jgi:hypothetical protein
MHSLQLSIPISFFTDQQRRLELVIRSEPTKRGKGWHQSGKEGERGAGGRVSQYEQSVQWSRAIVYEYFVHEYATIAYLGV